MSKKSIIFSTVIILVLGIISSIFLYSLINIIGDLFETLGGPLPVVSGFIIGTSPLVPVIIFLLYLVLAVVIFFIGGKLKSKNLKVFKVGIFITMLVLTSIVTVLALLLQYSVYQISTIIN